MAAPSPFRHPTVSPRSALPQPLPHGADRLTARAADYLRATARAVGLGCDRLAASVPPERFEQGPILDTSIKSLP